MRRWMVLAAAAICAAALWRAPAVAQEIATPAQLDPGNAPITFAEYRAFRLDDIARHEARLAERLAEAGLGADQTAVLARQKAYYDRLAAMPATERDRLFRDRFDRIDANHDGKLDPAERAAWREKQQEYYRQLALARAREGVEAHQ